MFNFNFNFENVTLSQFGEYFINAFRVFLAVIGIKIGQDTTDNVETMFDNIVGYQPEV